MASEAIINITREDIEWARQLSEEKRILDAQCMTREDEEFMRQYNKEKYEHYNKWLIYQDKRESLEKGRQEGRLEARLEVAKNLKASGVSVEIIAQATGISPEEIAKTC